MEEGRYVQRLASFYSSVGTKVLGSSSVFAILCMVLIKVTGLSSGVNDIAI